MSLFKRLAEIANKLDAKGLYEEANAIDNIIKNAYDFTGQNPFGDQPMFEVGPQKTTYTFPEDVIEGRKWPSTHTFPEKPEEAIVVDRAKSRRKFQQLDKLRDMFGLPRGRGFDRQLAIKLRQLNQKYPGVWTPGARQPISEIMANVEQAQTKEFEYARQKQQQQGGQAAGIQPSTLPSGSRAPAPQAVSPSTQQLFPERKMPPDVSLGPKKEYFPE